MLEKFSANIGNSNKSQKSIGIKKNNKTHQDFVFNKNLAKVDKNAPSKNSVCFKIGEDRNRSVSNLSNKSGLSNTRKIGYVPRSIYESKKGIILDYMT